MFSVLLMFVVLMVTHFSPVGAEVMASLAVDGIREQKLGLAKYLKRRR